MKSLKLPFAWTRRKLFLLLNTAKNTFQKYVNRKQNNQSRSNHPEPSKSPDPNRGRLDSTTTKPPQEDEHWKQEQKRFWERQIVCAKILNWITAVGTIAGLFGLYIIYQTLQATWVASNAAAKASDVAEKTLVASQRPWVSFDVEIAGPLMIEKNGFGLPLKITVKNVGHSPAVGVLPYPVIFVKERQPMDVLEVQKRRCSTVRHPPTRPNRSFGYTLFPGGVGITERNTPSNTREELESVLPAISPMIVVCADYQFTFTTGSHQTMTMYSLIRFDPLHPGQGFAINPREGLVPAASLRLIPIGSYAD